LKKTDSTRRKSAAVDIASSKKGSPTTSTTKISVKSGKGALLPQTEKFTEKSAPSSPVMSKTWKTSANYKIGASPNAISSPRHSTGGMPEDYKPIGRLSGSMKATVKPSLSPPPVESAKLRGRTTSLKK
jgi:hypothetical protein